MRSRRPFLVALAVLAAAVLWIVVWLGHADDAGHAPGDRADSATDSATAEPPVLAQREVSPSDADASRAEVTSTDSPPDAPAIDEGLELWAVLCAEGDEFLAEWIDNSLEFSEGVAEGSALHSGAVKVELWIGDEFALECSKSISVAPSAGPDDPPQEFELELSLDELRRAIDTSQR